MTPPKTEAARSLVAIPLARHTGMVGGITCPASDGIANRREAAMAATTARPGVEYRVRFAVGGCAADAWPLMYRKNRWSKPFSPYMQLAASDQYSSKLCAATAAGNPAPRLRLYWRGC